MNGSDRIVLTTFGSLGDLHPYIAVGLELRRRGAHVVIATSEYYREKIQSLGFEFAPLRPDMPDPVRDKARMDYLMDLREGPRRLICEFIMPVLRESYEDLYMATRPGDTLVTQGLTFAARMVAEKRNLRWISTILQPINFLSAHEQIILAPAPWLAKLQILGPKFMRALYNVASRGLASWVAPWHQLRSDLGLPPLKGNPIFELQHSPELVLAMFSRHFAAPMPDWPPQASTTGFCFYDVDTETELQPEVAKFIDAGAPPIVFTLGSAVVLNARDFYITSMAAARAVGRRAVLVTGKNVTNQVPDPAPDFIAVDYAPFSKLFASGAVIVHQGGVGTTGQALRSGRPSLVIPCSHDQPDNGNRVAKLGVGLSLPRASFTVKNASAALSRILDDERFARRARALGALVSAETGASTAADLILGSASRKSGGLASADR